MTNIQSLVEAFRNAHTVAQQATEAGNAKRSAADVSMNAIALHFVGNGVHGLDEPAARVTITNAYKAAYGKDIPAPTLSDYVVVAKAAASGIYQQADAAWKSWVAHCEANEDTTGNRYQTVRDLLRYSLAGGASNPDGSTTPFELSAGGIYDMREWKANAVDVKGALKRLDNVLAELREVGGFAWTPSTTLGSVNSDVRTKFAHLFVETKKTGKKTKTRPDVIVTVTPTATISPEFATEVSSQSAPIDMTAILAQLQSGDKRKVKAATQALAALQTKS